MLPSGETNVADNLLRMKVEREKEIEGMIDEKILFIYKTKKAEGRCPYGMVHSGWPSEVAFSRLITN